MKKRYTLPERAKRAVARRPRVRKLLMQVLVSEAEVIQDT